VGYPQHVVDQPAVVCGLVLAAGSGTRFGLPKALARTPDGTAWLTKAVRMLREAGCERVLVALGASADEASALVPGDAEIVYADDWAEGLSASVRAGLTAASVCPAEAVLITPVDTPDAPPDAARRVIDRAAAPLARALVRAVYRGRPGHPVLIGRDHWDAVAVTLTRDAGAGRYLSEHGALGIECADLWSGADMDRQPSQRG
jgi:CTP:molybdopterin cytidylyltransferase MocA